MKPQKQIQEAQREPYGKGFYKNGENNTLMYAPNFVYNKDYELLIDNQATYTYPIDGWYYFENEQEATTHFNL